jgi:hypothetical protein
VAAIVVFSPSVDGTPPTPGAAAAADTAIPGDKGRPNVLVVGNTSGSPVTVTIVTPGNLVSGVAFPDVQYTVPATTGFQWIPILYEYADPTTGTVAVNYSATTNVTRYLIRF